MNPEVQAAIIKVAGDWALALSKGGMSRLGQKDLIDNFTSMYAHILHIVKNN